MNIKGLISNILPTNEIKTAKVDAAIKSDKSNDRDANGQQTYDQQQEEKKPPMSDMQLEKAVEHLQNLPATKEHKWQIVLEKQGEGNSFVLVKDNLGNIIRRIPEFELWTLPTDQNPRGQLLHKAA